jgi:hypothetical protein
VAEFVAITFGIRRASYNRREKLVQIANKTFYDLYNILLDFVSAIIYNYTYRKQKHDLGSIWKIR